MKKKGSKFIQMTTDQLLHLINNNEATKTKEFIKFQEFKKKNKDYDLKKKESIPKINQLAEEFRLEMKRRGELVEGELDFSHSSNIDIQNSDNSEELIHQDNKHNTIENKIEKLNDSFFTKDFLDSDTSIDNSENVLNDEEMKKDIESMHNKFSDINHLMKEVSKSDRKNLKSDKKILIKDKNAKISITDEKPNKDILSIDSNDLVKNKEESSVPKMSTKIRNKTVENQTEKSIVKPLNNQNTVKLEDKYTSKKGKIKNDLIEIKKEKAELTKSKSKSTLANIKTNEKEYPHPEIGEILSLLYQKKINKLHKYDSIQLLAALKYIDYKVENIVPIINMISYIRKKNNIKIYNFTEIESSITYLINNLKNIEDSYLISLFYSLSFMNCEKELLIKEFLNEISIRHEKLNIREISNLTYSLSNFQLDFPKIYNFDSYFRELEAEIIKKLMICKKFNLDIDSQSISNIVISYCKTQNGSVEFYRILEEFIEENKSSFNLQELSNVVYSYSNNKDCSERVLELFLDIILKNIFKFQPKELCNVLRAYHRRNMINKQLEDNILESFIYKHEQMNSQDLSYFYSILAEEPNDISEKNNLENQEKKDIIVQNNDLVNIQKYRENKIRFLKYVHLCIEKLAFSFTGRDLSILFQKIKFMQEKSPSTFEKVKTQTLKLIDKNDFKGSDLNLVYKHTKGLKYEGKYDIFNEKIEQHLMKLKYNR